MSGTWDRDEAGAFVETLFAKHHGEIYAYLLRMLREPELAADLTQDAFVKAYKNYETLEKPENGSTRSPIASPSTRSAGARSSGSSRGRASRAGRRPRPSAW
jgi:predicted RNA polymerase sigma factor